MRSSVQRDVSLQGNERHWHSFPFLHTSANWVTKYLIQRPILQPDRCESGQHGPSSDGLCAPTHTKLIDIGITLLTIYSIILLLDSLLVLYKYMYSHTNVNNAYKSAIVKELISYFDIDQKYDTHTFQQVIYYRKCDISNWSHTSEVLFSALAIQSTLSIIKHML